MNWREKIRLILNHLFGAWSQGVQKENKKENKQNINKHGFPRGISKTKEKYGTRKESRNLRETQNPK